MDFPAKSYWGGPRRQKAFGSDHIDDLLDLGGVFLDGHLHPALQGHLVDAAPYAVPLQFDFYGIVVVNGDQSDIAPIALEKGPDLIQGLFHVALYFFCCHAHFFLTAAQPAIVVILIASVGGRSVFRATSSCTTLRVSSSKASSVGVAVCRAAGLPTSPASLIPCTRGISPKKGTSRSWARFLAPSFPKI